MERDLEDHSRSVVAPTTTAAAVQGVAESSKKTIFLRSRNSLIKFHPTFRFFFSLSFLGSSSPSSPSSSPPPPSYVVHLFLEPSILELHVLIHNFYRRNDIGKPYRLE